MTSIVPNFGNVTKGRITASGMLLPPSMGVVATCATAALIALGAIWGTLARLGLVALNSYDGQSVAPLIWAQAVGCLVFGFASHKRSKAAIEA